MRKLLAGGLFVMGVASLPVAISPGQTMHYPVRDYRNDPRLHTLRSFFRRWDCPAERYCPTFIEAADTYHLDWRLLPSISFVESSGGKAAPNNNMFGWDCGRAEFASMTEGIRTVARHLGTADRYRNKALDEILLAYNPNPEYSRIVKSVMNRIAP